MDPLTALSVAAAVVQFADFGCRLLRRAYEIYESPKNQSAKNIELSTVSRDLAHLVQDVELKLGENGNETENRNGQGQAQSQEEQYPNEAFMRLCRECRETNGQLQAIIGKLQARGTNRLSLAASSWMVALRQVAAAGDLDRLTERLNQIRQQIMVALLSQLLGEARRSGLDLRQFAHQQASMIATLDRIDQNTKQLSTDVVGLVDMSSSRHRTEANDMVNYVMSDSWDADEYSAPARVDKYRDRALLDRVFQALFFTTMGHREASIPKKYAETFEWIFAEPRKSKDGQPLWSSFPKWLQGDSKDIYWMSGKPGSGKSTLLKFISRDPRLEENLKVWAKGSEVLVASFFSWTAGMDKLQKTHEGLLRTLLLDLFRKKPQLLATAFPARWFLLQSFNGNVKLPPLDFDALMVAFRKLLSAAGDGMKLAFIIDGLDEFDEDHRELIQLLREANTKSGVKVCASSRPWNVFKDEYSKNPMLQLENLTRQDIKLFVKKKLELSPGYQDLVSTSPQAARKILSDIVNKAEGVFLWVSVVSGLLEGSFQEGARITDLQAIVDGLPSEVSELFRYIWDRTSKRFRAEASQYFQVMRACEKLGTNLFGLTLWFGDSDTPADLAAAEVTNEYLTGVAKSLERRLMSRTGGLLELTGDLGGIATMHVDFMHRTANDWVRDNWKSISAATEAGFDEWLWLFKGEALMMLLLSARPPQAGFWARVRTTLNAAYHVSDTDPVKTAILVKTIDRFDRYLMTVARYSHNPDGSYVFAGEGEGKHEWVTTMHWGNVMGKTSQTDDSETIPDTSARLYESMRVHDCVDMLGLAARLAIVPYVRCKAEQSPSRFRQVALSSNILECLVFSEHEHLRAGARLRLLESLLRIDDDRSWADRLRKIKHIAVTHPPFVRESREYFSQVVTIINAHLPVEPVAKRQQPATPDKPGRHPESESGAARKVQKTTEQGKSGPKLGMRLKKLFGRKPR
ncbi:hypothetical protein B0T24DRAFT_617096 [Lasiosphaeria ovina]|uniref:NACHT domain-containing protein n=1 Tax=Lasiosphaeria ovina TaxID=92902 RepID=A0AAE0KFH4_9PEZI|nr:hypothetical protein B0T24DRAFT_617096 [Lasiosphaeria ovina]